MMMMLSPAYPNIIALILSDLGSKSKAGQTHSSLVQTWTDWVCCRQSLQVGHHPLTFIVVVLVHLEHLAHMVVAYLLVLVMLNR